MTSAIDFLLKLAATYIWNLNNICLDYFVKKNERKNLVELTYSDDVTASDISSNKRKRLKPLGESLGLVVMGGDSCLRGCEFESQCLHCPFFTLNCCKIVLFLKRTCTSEKRPVMDHWRINAKNFDPPPQEIPKFWPTLSLPRNVITPNIVITLVHSIDKIGERPYKEGKSSFKSPGKLSTLIWQKKPHVKWMKACWEIS